MAEGGAPERRVLVIDDDPVSLQVVALQLQFEGCEVATSTGGEDALPLLAQLSYTCGDLILVDLQMPGLSGNELALRLRELADGAALLAMSATRPALDEIGAFDGFVQKPLDAAAVCGWGVAHDEKQDPAADGPQSLDPDTLSKLSKIMGPAALAEVFAACVSDTRARGQEMRSSAAAGDLERVRRDAHAIKGGAAMVGAQQLAAVAERIESEGYRSKELSQSLEDLFAACDLLERNVLRQMSEIRMPHADRS